MTSPLSAALVRYGPVASVGEQHGAPRTAARLAGRNRGEEGEGQSLVRGTARPHLRRLRADRGRTDGSALVMGARPVRAHRMATRRRSRRWWRHVDDVRPRLREGGRAYLDRARRVLARNARPDAGCE